MKILIRIQSPKNEQEFFYMPLEISDDKKPFWEDAWKEYGFTQRTVVPAFVNIIEP